MMSISKKRKNIKRNTKTDAPTIALVYPHQLFEDNPAVIQADHAVIVEEPLFFCQYPFHKQKIMLHRASMRWYADSLDLPCTYLEAAEMEETADVFTVLPDDVGLVHITKVSDDFLQKRLQHASKEHEVSLKWHSSPLFYLAEETGCEHVSDGDSYRMESFYRSVRKDTGILMNGDDPVGGEWNYDEENRESLPQDITLPNSPTENTNEYVKEARTYVDEHFSDNYGSAKSFYYPVTRTQANDWLENFLQHRFADFGPYQDAIDTDNHTLFHSMISPLLNIGLLEPQIVIKQAIDMYESRDVPLHSAEGFIRQIIGWREFMRLMYLQEGAAMRNKNYFDCTYTLPDAFWNGNLGIPPVDDVIRYVNQHGYAHHIERLMVLSNFMLLCEIDPTDVYEWFMTMFVDAYDWVMVPNVYDMGQFASGGVFATKPYISSSNYIRKMSDYAAGEWADVWDGLYWRFLDKYKEKLSSNHRMGLVMHQLDTMNEETIASHKQTAESFLSDIH